MHERPASSPVRGELSLTHSPDGTFLVRLAGAWQLHGGLPSTDEVRRALAAEPRPRRVAFDTRQLGPWDSALLGFLTAVIELCRSQRLDVDQQALPSGLRRLLALAEAVPEKGDARGRSAPASWLARLGVDALAIRDGAVAMLGFVGELTIAFARLLRGRARYRRVDLTLFIQQVGAEALPIVTLISFLVGAIFAFVGAVQLEQFGAAIYVADLVGIAIVREMGAVMTGIVLAGRTGAAFAAQLGTMKVTQEIDALATMGIAPLEFLVLPRVLALCLMMPMLCLYADFVGILGGAAVGIGMLHLPAGVYFRETMHAVHVSHLAGGILKGFVYGILVAISGCLRGLQSGKSSSAVGDAATSAVVTGIVFIITACGIFAVVFYVLGI